ncbi:hypothetical protein WI40_28880 [Burkholderia ubonensis]|uniref:fatty acyl-AMP ligase n=1 Tax=Burkholderia ubonensis TaxID=101571 RepID=UPI000752E025|nr:fatty acyl-AMP ligase [Burkholderia ubonensis]KUZ89236.1 hypothetical protein WI40_28880 [Burkholderia ubonensis]
MKNDDAIHADLAYCPVGGPSDDGPRTFARLLTHWAAIGGNAVACVMLDNEGVEVGALTYAELDRAATVLAAELAVRAEPGARALLMFPTGLAFVVAFAACHYASLVPVPVVPVRGRRMRDASIAIAIDCAPALVLTVPDYVDAVRDQFASLPGLARAAIVPVDAGVSAHAPMGPARGIDLPAPLALLQYTSGSTSIPKGVAVSQANLFANLEMQRRVFGNPPGATYVGWAPLYHDMGLICNLLEPLYVGGRAVLMSAGAFAQSPWLWLRAIDRYRARVSGGPNFAYDLCVARAERILREPLDLSHWTIAYNSAEPVRADTIRRFSDTFAPAGFRAHALRPCYGMAEATLLISASRVARVPTIESVDKNALALGDARPAQLPDAVRLSIGCGGALDAERIAIVDPATCDELPEGRIGEIWVQGPHVPDGYWNRPEQSRETFHAHIAGDASLRRYLRTRDLGYMRDGELFFVGRLKDVLIVRGRNVYPQDIERIAECAYPGMKPNSSAAFALDEDTGTPRYVLVQEVERGVRRTLDHDLAARAIRRAVLDEFDMTLNEIRFVEPGSIPKTSSGKIRRGETRDRYGRDMLAAIDRPLRVAQSFKEEDRDVVG